MAAVSDVLVQPPERHFRKSQNKDRVGVKQIAISSLQIYSIQMTHHLKEH